ncbi:MAG: LysM peptidoglycan-binding domain-containing protein [Chloroflexota bacterium]
MRKLTILAIILSILLSACTRSTNARLGGTLVPIIPVYDPNQPTSTPQPVVLPPTRVPGAPISSPTPDGNVSAFPTFTPIAQVETQPAANPGMQSYTVADGDYPASIAGQFGITVDELLAANNLSADTVIYPGDTLQVPVTNQNQLQAVSAAGTFNSSEYFKILPDSELVYGPASASLDINAFVQQKGGFLSVFTQDVNGKTLTGAEVVSLVAHNYSINPRVLLALLEYQAGWLTNPTPASAYNPIGFVDDFHQGLYRQLTWSASQLNTGFYAWREHRVQNWDLYDGSQIMPQPGINAGTAGVQQLFARLDGHDSWIVDTGPNGFFATFTSLFGYPFDFAIEPIVPADISQPVLSLPFGPGESWQFTGGPHAGWDVGTAWAALDFAPPGEPVGCGAVDYWNTAVAPGLIVRADNGAVIEDLDGDGLEQTGWTILYMHMEARDRVQSGTYVNTGDHIGHPSCDGGLADADHIHIARRYNGVWIPAADPGAPFVMDGYVTSGTGTEYDGKLTNGSIVVEAWDGSNTLNQIKK